MKPNKGNAAWQALSNEPQVPVKIKLRLTPEDVYGIKNGKTGFRDGGTSRARGPVKEGGNR